MTMYPAWKISSDCKEDTNNSLQIFLFVYKDGALKQPVMYSWITYDMLFDHDHVYK